MRLRVLAASAALAFTITTVAPAHAKPPRAPYRNPEGRIAGIVITGLASATLIAAFGVIGADVSGTSGDTRGLAAIYVGLPMIGGSAVLAGIGIGVWVSCAQPAARSQAELPAWLPTVVPARNGAGLRWTF